MRCRDSRSAKSIENDRIKQFSTQLHPTQAPRLVSKRGGSFLAKVELGLMS